MADTKGYPSDDTRARILIVEEREGLARVLKGNLERAGHEVHVEAEGKRALLFAAEHRTDLVVLDIALPDMSGCEVCLELRRLYRPWSLPVVMLTAADEPKHHLLGFRHGADANLTIPVHSSDLVGTVAEMLHRAGPRR